MAGLVADYGSDSESNDSTKNSEEEKATVILPKPRFELPKPDFKSGTTDNVENSVFVNPFIEAVNAKNAILEKHVKMISTDVKTLNGKTICWNYRKNKCRFGHNCKYAHDSDIQQETVVEGDTKQVNAVVQESNNEEKSEEDLLKTKRKRPGLSQTLVPGKKVMKMYNQQKYKRT